MQVGCAGPLTVSTLTSHKQGRGQSNTWTTTLVDDIVSVSYRQCPAGEGSAPPHVKLIVRTRTGQHDQGLNCVDCLPGYYTAVEGQSECKACPVGTYANERCLRAYLSISPHSPHPFRSQRHCGVRKLSGGPCAAAARADRLRCLRGGQLCCTGIRALQSVLPRWAAGHHPRERARARAHTISWSALPCRILPVAARAAELRWMPSRRGNHRHGEC
jgi:hypothetical protein